MWYSNEKSKEIELNIVKQNTDNYTITTALSSFKTSFTEFSSNKATTTKIKNTVTTAVSVDEVLYININTADSDDLCKLNGIGKKTADSIISYRNDNGGFKNIEELMNIYGIGESTFLSIKGYIYVENPVYPEIEDDIYENDSSDEFYEDEFYEEDTVIPDNTESALTLEDVSPVDINTAEIEVLVLLPYIDEEKAEKIVRLREEIHGFSDIYELLYIDGISAKQLSEISDFIYIQNES